MLILIKNLGTRLGSTGRKESWAIFLCSFCLQEVERYLMNGKKCKSCGCQRWSETVRQKMSNSAKNKIFTIEHRKNISLATSGINNPFYGKKHTEETIERLRGENNPMYGIHRFGEKAPNWIDGSSFEPYPIEFNKELKQQIHERDNYTCQCPDCRIENPKKLDCHHIDYDKQNNNPENLITLCASCHVKTNGKNKRQYWTEFYQNIMMNKLMECLL